MDVDGAGGIFSFSDEALRAAENVILAGSACNGAFDGLIVKATAAMRVIIKGETLPLGSADQFMAELRREERSFGHEMRDVARFNFCKVLAGVIDKHEQPADAAQMVKEEPGNDVQSDQANPPSLSSVQGGDNSDHPPPNHHSPSRDASQDRRMNEDAAATARDTPQDAQAKLELFDCKPGCDFFATSFERLCQHAESAHPAIAEQLIVQCTGQLPKKYARRTEKATSQPPPCSASSGETSANTLKTSQEQVTHHGEYPCTFQGSNRKFVYPNSIGRHIRLCHTNGPNYSCHLCEKRFTQRDNRISHIMLVHGGGAMIQEIIDHW